MKNKTPREALYLALRYEGDLLFGLSLEDNSFSHAFGTQSVIDVVPSEPSTLIRIAGKCDTQDVLDFLSNIDEELCVRLSSGEFEGSTLTVSYLGIDNISIKTIDDNPGCSTYSVTIEYKFESCD